MTYAEYNTDDNYDKKESSLDELVKIGASEGKSLDDIKGSLSPKWQKSKYINELGNYYDKYSVKPKTEEKPAEKKEEVKETVTTETPATTSAISKKDENFYEKQAGLADNAEDTEYERQDEEEQKRRNSTLDRMKFSGEGFKVIDDHAIENLPTFMFRRYQNGEFGDLSTPEGKKDAKLRMAYFMINGVGTALQNASAAIKGGQMQDSDYETYKKTNLAQGLENRWNKYKQETDAAAEILRKQNMDEQEIQGSIAKVSANARLQSAFNMMNENQKVYTLQVLSKIGNEIGNMNNKDFVNTLIGFATSGDNLDWQEAAELLVARFGPDALKGLKNIKDETELDEGEVKTAGVGGGISEIKLSDGTVLKSGAAMNKQESQAMKEKADQLLRDYDEGKITKEQFKKDYETLVKYSDSHGIRKFISGGILPYDKLLSNSRDTAFKNVFGKDKNKGKKAVEFFEKNTGLFDYFKNTKEPNYVDAKKKGGIDSMKEYENALAAFNLLSTANALNQVGKW